MFKQLLASLKPARRRRLSFQQTVPGAVEVAEPRLMLTALEWSSGNWILVSPEATASASFNLDVPDSETQHAGSELKIHYEIAKDHAPQFQTILDDGLFRQHAPEAPLLTSYFLTRYFSSTDQPMPNPDLESAEVLGVDGSGNLKLRLIYAHDDPGSGDSLTITAVVDVHPPTTFNTSMTWNVSITNDSGRDIAPFWQGHRTFGEQWVAFGASTMYRNDRGVRPGTPAQYVGDITNGSDYLDDARSAVQNILVSPHDTKEVQFAGGPTVILQPQMNHVVYPGLEWYTDNVADDLTASDVRLQHFDDHRRDHRIELLSAGGLLTSTNQFDWSIQRDQSGPDDVDGDDTLVRAGFNSINAFPEGALLNFRVRFTSGPAPGFTGGLVITETDDSTQVVEGGQTDTIMVALSTHPTRDVTLQIDTDELEVTAPKRLIFTRENWDVPQAVEVAAVDDNVADGTRQIPLRFRALAGSDSLFVVMPTQTVTVTTIDNDSGVPQRPDLTGPLGDPANPTFTWTGQPGETSEIWLSRLAPKSERLFGNQSVIAGRSFTTPEALKSGLYRVWVQNRNANGDRGPWSESRTFEVKPTLISPLGITFDKRPTFTWNAVPDASGYHIFVRMASGDIVDQNVAGTSWTPPRDLDDSQSVRWWVRAVDLPGNRGWSDVGEIDASGRTSVLGPNGQTTNRMPTILWAAVVGAGRYILHVQNLDTNIVAIREDRLSASSFSPATELAPGNYRVWVKAIDAASDLFSSGRWSRHLDFTIV